MFHGVCISESEEINKYTQICTHTHNATVFYILLKTMKRVKTESKISNISPEKVGKLHY